jgi:hypothetical protein
MTINGSYTAAALTNLDRSSGTENEVGVAMLKKAQDQQTQEAQALIQGIESSTPKCPSGCGKLLDTYA